MAHWAAMTPRSVAEWSRRVPPKVPKPVRTAERKTTRCSRSVLTACSGRGSSWRDRRTAWDPEYAPGRRALQANPSTAPDWSPAVDAVVPAVLDLGLAGRAAQRRLVLTAVRAEVHLPARRERPATIETHGPDRTGLGVPFRGSRHLVQRQLVRLLGRGRRGPGVLPRRSRRLLRNRR